MHATSASREVAQKFCNTFRFYAHIFKNPVDFIKL